MKTAISIPDSLFEAAEALAHRLGISRSELYRRAVAAYLKRTSREAVTSALDEVYGADAEAGLLDPAVAWLQGASLWRRRGNAW
jgi:predicted transcriptional regulator